MVPISIPLFPLNTVFFPDGLLPLQVFEVRYLDMVNRCIKNGTEFGVVLLTAGSEVRLPETRENLAPVGTMASIREWKAPMPGLLKITCTGTRRFRIASSEQLKHGLWMAEATLIDDDQPVPVPAELGGVARALERVLASLEEEGVSKSEMPVAGPYRMDDCGWLANRWCELLPLSSQRKQDMLTLDNPVLRLELVYDVLDSQGLLG